MEAVVIGASAGGVDALLAVLPSVPAPARVPFVVVLHLPARPSLVTEIFAPRCALEIREAEDKLRLRPGVVHFAPPDYHVLIEEGGTLSLSVDERVHFARPSIDVLFDSAAWVYGERCLGVLLTGANGDGASGLERIARAGGVTAIQEPKEALFPAMPAAARARFEPDLVLPLSKLADLFAGL